MAIMMFSADLVTIAQKLHSECDEFEMAEFFNALADACDGVLSVNFDELDAKAFKMLTDLVADLEKQKAFS